MRPRLNESTKDLLISLRKDQSHGKAYDLVACYRSNHSQPYNVDSHHHSRLLVGFRNLRTCNHNRHRMEKYMRYNLDRTRIR